MMDYWIREIDDCPANDSAVEITTGKVRVVIWNDGGVTVDQEGPNGEDLGQYMIRLSKRELVE